MLGKTISQYRIIDQLGEVQALSVISANGVRPYRGRPVRLDSLGAVLGVTRDVAVGDPARAVAELDEAIRRGAEPGIIARAADRARRRNSGGGLTRWAFSATSRPWAPSAIRPPRAATRSTSSTFPGP